MYSTEILVNTATIREVNSTAIDLFCLKLCVDRKTWIAHQDSAELQTTKQILTTSKQSTEFISVFPCYLKVNRDELALITDMNRLTITAGSLAKIDQHDNFTCVFSRRYRGQRTNQMAGPVTLLGKNKYCIRNFYNPGYGFS